MKNNANSIEIQSSTLQSANYKTQMQSNIVDHNGNTLFSIVYPNPDKETLILLHGGPGFPNDLSAVADLLKDYFQVITFHQRGTQKSPCRDKDYSMQAYLSDIETVREFYKINKFHLWGHSWGGLYAKIYAEKHPDNLLSLFYVAQVQVPIRNGSKLKKKSCNLISPKQVLGHGQKWD
ncbi:alpha/beta fold hydrolase [Acinetobacter guillouiae]|uniref:alpha/beta fold hydrolase n=1 Tax=Acinetobacter guillouiae TaxID=106649 RepID=UPI003C6F027C